MGNNQSSGSKSATPPSGSTSSHDTARHHHHHTTTTGTGLASSSRTSKESSSASSSSRNILPAHGTHRSAAAPPEPSLAQAHGSTSIASRPKSISATSSTLPPTTALSSLNASPHSTTTSSAAKAAAAAVAAAQQLLEAGPAAPIPIAEPSKPVDVPGGGSSVSRTPGINRTDSEMADAQLLASGSKIDMYNARPPRLPLPIEEEVHTPGSPILGADELAPGGDVPGIDQESSDGLTRKSSAVSQATVDDEDNHELRVDRSRPVVPTRIEWNAGGEKVYVTGTIFQWSRKQRLHPV